MNPRFMSALVVRHTNTGTTLHTHLMSIAVGQASTDVSITQGRATASDHMSRDPGWMTTPQRDCQQTVMDANWGPMQKNRLTVKIVNKLPDLVDRTP